MKTKIILIVLIATILLLLAGGIFLRIYNARSVSQWRESRSLVKIWPRLMAEKIESIKFCDAVNPKTGAWDTESNWQHIIEFFSYRKRDANEVKTWIIAFDIPKSCLPECVRLIDAAVKKANFPVDAIISVWPYSRMLVITQKGKYIFNIDTDITNAAKSNVHGEDWVSYDLGEYLKKCGFPVPTANSGKK
jgi:hypothetical protein